MPLVTLTTTTTDPVFVSPPDTPMAYVTTVTIQVATTVPATPGQTITLLPLPQPAATTTIYTTLPQPTETFIASEFAVYLEGPRGDIWTTFTLEVNPTSPSSPGGASYIIGSSGADNGWDSWSKAQKGGCIAGVILFVLFVAGLLFCVHRRRKEWVAWNHSTNTAQNQGMAMGDCRQSQPYVQQGWRW